MHRSVRILLALVLGLLLGGLAATLRPDLVEPLTAIAAPVGKIWLDALKMTIVPLVFSLLVTGIASTASAASAGGLTARALATFIALLSLSALFASGYSTAILDLLPIAPDAVAALRGGIAEGSVPPPPAFADWVSSIVPSNIVKAAADSAMLSIVLVALLFGFAVLRIGATARVHLLGFFEAVAETMLVIVSWVLWVAPIGVFALAFVVTATTGFAAIGGLAYYLLLVCSLCTCIGLFAYLLAATLGGQPLGRFARAAAPAQAVAASTQSSLASMPAMLDGLQNRLDVPARIAGVVLPMAVAVFRVTSPAVNLTIGLFAARIYGIDLTPAQIATGVVVAVIVSMSTVSLPSQITFFAGAGPISMAMGVPLDLLAILIAVETIPDIFRTTATVTMDMAATTAIARVQESGDQRYRQNPA